MKVYFTGLSVKVFKILLFSRSLILQESRQLCGWRDSKTDQIPSHPCAMNPKHPRSGCSTLSQLKSSDKHHIPKSITDSYQVHRHFVTKSRNKPITLGVPWLAMHNPSISPKNGEVYVFIVRLFLPFSVTQTDSSEKNKEVQIPLTILTQ